MSLRRMKTYAGGQGYVYQYYFVGQRATLPGEPAGTEYIFDVTSDRKTTFAVSVFLPDEVAENWAAVHGRALSEAERYAGAKLRLLQAFDEIEDMLHQGRRLMISAGELDRTFETLGLAGK